MKKTTLFALGLLLGYGLSSWLHREPVPAPAVVVAENPAAQSRPIAKPLPSVAIAKPSAPPVARVEVPVPESRPPNFEVPTDEEELAPAKHQAARGEINFSEGLTQQLENEWIALPSQVQLARDERGWRVLDLKADSLFAQTGLRPGDLIDAATIEELGGASAVDLRSRVIRLLDSVTR